MYGHLSKRFFIILIAVCLLGPIALMAWNPQLGAILFLCGLAIAYRSVHILRALQLTGMIRDQQALHHKRNHSQTIFVQLIDDYGNDLPPEIAQEKLALAQRQAGPRDTVVGVRRKVL